MNSCSRLFVVYKLPFFALKLEFKLGCVIYLRLGGEP